MQFFLAGGFPMILITVFGAVAVVSAVRFAFGPRIGRLVHLCASCVALLSAGTAGVAATFDADWHPALATSASRYNMILGFMTLRLLSRVSGRAARAVLRALSVFTKERSPSRIGFFPVKRNFGWGHERGGSASRARITVLQEAISSASRRSSTLKRPEYSPRLRTSCAFASTRQVAGSRPSVCWSAWKTI